MALTYVPPTITVSQQGAQAPLIGAQATKTVMLLGTAPSGPDYPTLITSAQASLFGNPSAASSIGYTLPYMLYLASLQRPPYGYSPFNFLVCRAGVTRGTKVVQDSVPSTCFTLAAVGKYAGSASQFLQVALTVVSSRVSNITFTDSRTNTTLQSFTDINTAGGLYNLGTNAGIVAAINGANPLNNPASIVQATIGASSNVPVAFAATSFSTGTDGLSAAYNDATIGTPGSGGLLDQSLGFSVDYICAGFDANLIATNLLNHVGASAGGALAQLQFRKVILGPKIGTVFGSSGLTGATYIGSSLQNSRLVITSHESLYGPHPATGTLYAFDGFFGAAALAGLKASAPTQETVTGFPLTGFTQLGTHPDLTAPLTTAQELTMAQKGFTVLQQPFGGADIVAKDVITTAPYSSNGATINPFYQFNVQDIDDAVSTVKVAAAKPLLGRPRANASEATGLMQATLQRAILGLGDVINGLNSVTVTIDPNTQAYNETTSYVTRLANLQIALNQGFTFS